MFSEGSKLQAQVKVGPHTIITVTAETQKELFKEIASAHEVFGERKCGLCGTEGIIPVHRTVTKGKKTYEYPEYHCPNRACRARLSLGSMQEGGQLFPIRKLTAEGKPSREEGTFDPRHMGWTRYKGKPGEDDGGDDAAKK